MNLRLPKYDRNNTSQWGGQIELVWQIYKLREDCCKHCECYFVGFSKRLTWDNPVDTIISGSRRRKIKNEATIRRTGDQVNPVPTASLSIRYRRSYVYPTTNYYQKILIPDSLWNNRIFDWKWSVPHYSSGKIRDRVTRNGTVHQPPLARKLE